MQLTVKQIAIVVASVGISLFGVRSCLSEKPQKAPTAAEARKAKKNPARSHGRLISTNNEPSLARERIEAAGLQYRNRRGEVIKRMLPEYGTKAEADWVFPDGKPWPEEQKVLMRAIVDAGENEDFSSVAALASDVGACTNPEIRERYVEEIGWFGSTALPELTPFLADADESVVEAVRTQWIDAVQTIDDDAEKASTMILVMQGVSDREALDTVSNELVSMDELMALQTIVDVISTGTPEAVAAMKEVYKTITDQDWTDGEAAEEWLQANYELPEDGAAEGVSGQAEDGMADGEAGQTAEQPVEQGAGMGAGAADGTSGEKAADAEGEEMASEEDKEENSETEESDK